MTCLGHRRKWPNRSKCSRFSGGMKLFAIQLAVKLFFGKPLSIFSDRFSDDSLGPAQLKITKSASKKCWSIFKNIVVLVIRKTSQQLCLGKLLRRLAHAFCLIQVLGQYPGRGGLPHCRSSGPGPLLGCWAAAPWRKLKNSINCVLVLDSQCRLRLVSRICTG